MGSLTKLRIVLTFLVVWPCAAGELLRQWGLRPRLGAQALGRARQFICQLDHVNRDAEGCEDSDSERVTV